MLSCRFAQRPRAIVLAGKPRAFSQEEVDAAREQGRQEGLLAGRREVEEAFVRDQKRRVDAFERIIKMLSGQNEMLVLEFCQMLPDLVIEAVRRVLANTEIDASLVVKIVSEMVGEIHPGTSGLEVILSEHDFGLFEQFSASFQLKYPGISFVGDSELLPGDCIIRSRFGTFDGRVSTKINNVEGLLR